MNPPKLQRMINPIYTDEVQIAKAYEVQLKVGDTVNNDKENWFYKQFQYKLVS